MMSGVGGMGRSKLEEIDIRDLRPVSGIVEPDFLEHLKETFRRWQQYHREGVPLGCREIGRLSSVVDGARLNSHSGFEKSVQRFTDEGGQEWISLLIYRSRDEMKAEAEPLYRFAVRIHK